MRAEFNAVGVAPRSSVDSAVELCGCASDVRVV
jgi:hypothetical protein